jgi:hypothetical protein
LLCDAPGLGKTLSALSAIASTKDQDQRLAIIFAGKGIVDNVWVEQIHRHFEPRLTGLVIFCADSENAKHEFAQPLSTRAAGTTGGVYVDERPTARLPDSDVLRSFDVLVLAKEMLSQKVEPEDNKVRRAGSRPPDHPHPYPHATALCSTLRSTHLAPTLR